MSSDNPSPIAGYPSVMPLSLEGIYKVFTENVVNEISDLLPAKQLAEEAFWAGAESVMSVMVRAKHLGATPEEGAQVIGRMFQEIAARAADQEARILRATRNAPRD